MLSVEEEEDEGGSGGAWSAGPLDCCGSLPLLEGVPWSLSESGRLDLLSGDLEDLLSRDLLLLSRCLPWVDLSLERLRGERSSQRLLLLSWLLRV